MSQLKMALEGPRLRTPSPPRIGGGIERANAGNHWLRYAIRDLAGMSQGFGDRHFMAIKVTVLAPVVGRVARLSGVHKVDVQSPTYRGLQQMKTVFYAWQSDLSNRTNRGFIEDCLQRAIDQANASRAQDDQLVLDKDTQGEPGMPDIARVIFDKIENSAVFVPDLSFITRSSTGKPVPNPNVLIELGYALRAIGEGRIVGLFNSATGSPEELPFDLRSRRWPFVYCLTDDASTEERQRVRLVLVNALVKALTAAAARSEAPAGQDTDDRQHAGSPYDQAGRFFSGFSIAQIDPSVPGTGADGNVIWRNSVQACLQVCPKERKASDSFSELKALAIKPDYHLRPFGVPEAQWHTRNVYGYVVGDILSDPRHPRAVCITQLDRSSGELYGINQRMFDRDGDHNVIMADRIQKEFELTLGNYINFYRANPKFGESFSLYAQFQFVARALLKVRLADGSTPSGYITDSLIYHGVDSFALDCDVNEILRPLFVKLWDNAGFDYPIGKQVNGSNA